MILVPVTSYCGSGCSTTTMVPIFYPPHWEVRLENCDFKKKNGDCKRESYRINRDTWERLTYGDFFDAKAKS